MTYQPPVAHTFDQIHLGRKHTIVLTLRIRCLQLSFQYKVCRKMSPPRAVIWTSTYPYLPCVHSAIIGVSNSSGFHIILYSPHLNPCNMVGRFWGWPESLRNTDANHSFQRPFVRMIAGYDIIKLKETTSEAGAMMATTSNSFVSLTTGPRVKRAQWRPLPLTLSFH